MLDDRTETDAAVSVENLLLLRRRDLDELLERAAERGAERGAERALAHLGLDKGLAAVVDFCFKLGAGRLQTSTLRRRINQREWSEAAREMRRWVHAGGRVLPGLQARREIAAQWLECDGTQG